MADEYERLVAAAVAEPVEGWDFSWLAGRASEQRPSWGYVRLLADRLGLAEAVLDVQTGGGEVYAEALARTARVPHRVVAAEGWPPNRTVARRNLAPYRGTVVGVAEDGALPFATASFDLLASRHPTGHRWAEVARLLRPGGTYLSQGVGAGSNRRLYEALLGPQPPTPEPGWRRAAAAATAAGLAVTQLRHETVQLQFDDIGAVVYFLRKVVWTVPDFEVARYEMQLRRLHEQMPFVSYAHRYLIEARKS